MLSNALKYLQISFYSQYSSGRLHVYLNENNFMLQEIRSRPFELCIISTLPCLLSPLTHKGTELRDLEHLKYLAR